MNTDKETIIVGNSADLLDFSFGAYIDSFDSVARCNLAKTKGYEKHVGTKFTSWVTSELFKVPKVYKEMYWLGISKLVPEVKRFATDENISLTVVAHGHRQRATTRLLGEVKRPQLTTGIAFVLYMVEKTDVVPTVIGFDGYDSKRAASVYYWNDIRGTRYVKCYDLHKRILTKLHEQGKIKWIGGPNE